MKKVLAYSLTAALLLVSLTACNKPQDTQQTDQSRPTQAATSSPADVSTPEPPAQNTSETLSNKVPATNANEASQLPEETAPQEPDGTAEPTFTDCNETVYATGTVNLRSGPSTEDEKAGSLNKGDAVNRIGIGTGEYKEWSLILTKDWKLVYVASDYLSTTKPAEDKVTTPSKPQDTSKPVPSTSPTGVDDGGDDLISIGTTGQELPDDVLNEGVDPNKDPWDTKYKPIYGGG